MMKTFYFSIGLLAIFGFSKMALAGGQAKVLLGCTYEEPFDPATKTPIAVVIPDACGKKVKFCVARPDCWFTDADTFEDTYHGDRPSALAAAKDGLQTRFLGLKDGAEVISDIEHVFSSEKRKFFRYHSDVGCLANADGKCPSAYDCYQDPKARPSMERRL